MSRRVDPSLSKLLLDDHHGGDAVDSAEAVLRHGLAGFVFNGAVVRVEAVKLRLNPGEAVTVEHLISEYREKLGESNRRWADAQG